MFHETKENEATEPKTANDVNEMQQAAALEARTC